MHIGGPAPAKLEEILRLAALSFALAAICLPAVAGEPYQPIKLKPAETVTPSQDLIDWATAFLDAVEKGNGDAIGAGIADKIVTVDGGLELAISRHKETLGPFKTTEEKLTQLGYNTGGDLPVTADGSDVGRFAIGAAREFIVESMTARQAWGTDPMMPKGTVCTYAYRSFDAKAVKKLADKLKIQSSSLFYVDAATEVLATPDAKGTVAATLQPDLLYALDYDTDAPGRWIAVHLPEGGAGFVNFDKVELQKPYASGVCFLKTKGGWQMVGQASTSL